jgi:hypothetical protein
MKKELPLPEPRGIYLPRDIQEACETIDKAIFRSDTFEAKLDRSMYFSDMIRYLDLWQRELGKRKNEIGGDPTR